MRRLYGKKKDKEKMNDKHVTWLLGFLGGCITGTVLYLIIKYV